MGRCYEGQYCPIAHALGVVGERWSLLVVRELLHGPRRYTDLAAGLPGIGTNILAARLKDLEAGGVLRKAKLPPPAAAAVYELTPLGEALRPVLHELARWGVRGLGRPEPGDLHPGWLPEALEFMLPAEGDAVVAFRVDGQEAAWARGRVVDGVPEERDVLVEGDADALYDLLVHRRLDAVRLEGDAAALERVLDGVAPVPLPA